MVVGWLPSPQTKSEVRHSRCCWDDAPTEIVRRRSESLCSGLPEFRSKAVSLKEWTGKQQRRRKGWSFSPSSVLLQNHLSSLLLFPPFLLSLSVGRIAHPLPRCRKHCCRPEPKGWVSRFPVSRRSLPPAELGAGLRRRVPSCLGNGSHPPDAAVSGYRADEWEQNHRGREGNQKKARIRRMQRIKVKRLTTAKGNRLLAFPSFSR